MTTNGLRTQYPYGGEALSPRPLYDFPSPTSNYPSGVSPGFVPPTAFRNPARFGSSAFIPPPNVFMDALKGQEQEPGMDTLRDFRARRSEVLNSDPVAMHLLVETAMGDSQYFDILSVEEVETLKQEQKVLDSKLNTVRKRLESETKIRDAALSLTRLTSKRDKGHRRGLSSRGSNATRDKSALSDEDLDASTKKVNDLSRDLLEIESRMRLIDAQLLMHTAAVLQLTHSGPTKKVQRSHEPNGGVQRPDSPASIYNYESNRSFNPEGEDHFDERSLYRSPENLDSLMNALQNGTHLHSDTSDRQSQSLNATAKRLEDLNKRLRELIVQANPERAQEYALTPQNTDPDASSMDQQLDFLDKGLREISANQLNARNSSKHVLNAVEGRLEGINNQLYAMLSRSDENAQPPPPITGGGSQEQLNYMEDSFYNVEQVQYTMTEQLEELRTKSNSNQGVEQYEATLMGLWDIIQAGEEQARQRKRERRELLANDPDADEELSPDEDYVPEEFSLHTFSAKVQWLYRRASTLKDKQSILVRQIKQQRELNSRSDAQKEEQFGQLKEQVLSARSEKASMEKELDRAMGQLKDFDQEKISSDSRALEEAEKRIESLEAELKDAQDGARIEMAAVQTERSQSTAQMDDIKAALQVAVAEKEAAQAELAQSSARAEESTAALRSVTSDREAVQAELAQASGRLEETLVSLRTISAEREAAENRSTEATSALKAKEEELKNLEGEVIRLTTELTFAKAELDGAYGTRAERAAESAASPELKKELEDLSAKNTSLLTEIESLRKMADAASQSEAEARDSERNLKQELSGMAAEYEQLTRDSIQNEKDRDGLEASIDKLRDEKESLEMELSDERVKWLGVRSPSIANGAANMEATSIRMLREDFRKMMRDRTAEGLKALRNEQEERRKLEAMLRSLRKDSAPQKSNLSKTLTAS